LIASPDFHIDTNRIHATGVSNGGEMTYYLACALSQRIASNGGVAGQMAYSMIDSICTPDRPVSVLHMLGTADQVFPVNGNTWFPPLEGAAEYWAMQDNCDTIPFPTQLPDIDTTDGSTVTLLTYPSCYQGYEVRCYRIEGGGHNWPGGEGAGQPGINNDINASVELWNFFKRNPHPRSYPFCLPEGIDFTSQQEIDEFQDYYPNCVEIEGDVKISGDDIIDLNGLSQLTYVGGDLSIYGNDSLEDLSGLDNLVTIGGDLNIGKDLHPWGTSGNPSMTSLIGLDNLSSIGGNLFIAYNPSLTELFGLDSLSAASIDSLFIFDNMSLSSCNANSICDYLLNYNGFSEIHDNTVGCDSQEEVEDACVVGVDQLAVGNRQLAVKVWPNPTRGSSQFAVRSSQADHVIIKLYDLHGREVATVIDQQLPAGEHTVSFNAGLLPPGVYIYRKLDNWTVGSWTTGKLIKF
jgi:hypothetical protein